MPGEELGLRRLAGQNGRRKARAHHLLPAEQANLPVGRGAPELLRENLGHGVVDVENEGEPMDQPRPEGAQGHEVGHRVDVDQANPAAAGVPEQPPGGPEKKPQIGGDVAEAARPAVAVHVHPKELDAAHALAPRLARAPQRQEIDRVSRTNSRLGLAPHAWVGFTVGVRDHREARRGALRGHRSPSTSL